MKLRFKTRKGSGIYVAVIAGLAFIILAVLQFNLSLETVLQFLGITVVLIAAIALLAAPVALAIRWWANKRDE